MKNDNIRNKIDTCPVCGGTTFDELAYFRNWADEKEIVMQCYDCNYRFTEIWKFVCNIEYEEK